VTSRPALGTVIAACRDVTVVYGESGAPVRALDEVALEIEGGESLALLGRSGSGKTTLLHVLGGLVEPTTGTVEWQGRPLDSVAHGARGVVRTQGIGFVFQAANLLPHFTAFENVAFAAQLAEDETQFEFAARALLKLVGLDAKADHLPAELSGGEAQRVAIARALAQQPLLLLCDEPTGHLDSDTGERVLDLIEALRAELSFTLVLATHDPGVAARLQREIELEDGHVSRDERA